MCSLHIDKFLDPLLDQIGEHPYIQIQPLHILIVGSAHQSIRLNLLHPVLQCIQTLENSADLTPGIFRIRQMIQCTKILTCLIDHSMGLLHACEFFCPCHIDDYGVHGIIHVLFEMDAVCIGHGNIVRNGIIAVGEPAQQDQQIYDEYRKGYKTHKGEYIESFLQMRSFFLHGSSPFTPSAGTLPAYIPGSS